MKVCIQGIAECAVLQHKLRHMALTSINHDSCCPDLCSDGALAGGVSEQRVLTELRGFNHISLRYVSPGQHVCFRKQLVLQPYF